MIRKWGFIESLNVKFTFYQYDAMLRILNARISQLFFVGQTSFGVYIEFFILFTNTFFFFV